MTKPLHTVSTIAAAFSLAIILGTAAAQEPKKPVSPATSSIWMQQKLKATEGVLGGLTRADFDAITANAGSMLAVGYLEAFARADTPGYRELMADFRYANKALMLAGKEKNLDGATVAYVQLTLSCVNCHKIVRDVK